MSLFEQILSSAQSAGFFGFFLPFLLTFALIYGLLNKSQLFGPATARGVSALNAVISMVAAFYVIGFTPIGMTIAQFLGNFFTQWTIILLAFIVGILAAFVLQPFWPREQKAKYDQNGRLIGYEKGEPTLEKTLGKYIGFGIFLALIGVFINSGGLNILGIDLNAVNVGGIAPQDVIIIAIIIFTIGMVVFLTRGGKGE